MQNSKGKQDKTGPKLLWIKIKKLNEDSGHGITWTNTKGWNGLDNDQ